ncbi:unnamed protein product [Mycena citricolor]|uniref:Phosphoglycerate mutase n=1 Tax=Mycena citricolor TaxID=2018698 RepID=A0AAD2GQT0_9AGAR|nr:unnamed protein product [Mycena citricolor]
MADSADTSNALQIRHGQSEDNLRDVWAGWKDAPLSELGMKQADALGQSFRDDDTGFDFLYASDLLRAHSTGLAVLDAHREPKPAFAVSEKLREQYFGIAEGNRWLVRIPSDQTREQLYEQKLFPVFRSRHEKFPEGESLDDLAERADEAVKLFILPHIKKGTNVRVAIASHGLCISELVAALLRLDSDSKRDVSYAGLLNTAWTRAVDTSFTGPIDSSNPPPLNVKITHVNNSEHYNLLQGTNTNPVPVGEESSGARAFFGGKTEI